VSARLTRAGLNFLLDVVGLLLMLGLVFTGALIRYLLPPGSTGRHGGRALTLLGLDRHDWGGIHFWIAVALLALLALHVALHWSWVCALCRRGISQGRRIAWGVGFAAALVLLLAGLFAWSGASVEARVWTPGTAVAGSGTAWVREATSPEKAQEPAAPGKAGEAQARSPRRTASDEVVRGFMTLREVAITSGVPVEHLRRSLRLPAGTEEERLGRLKRRFGFQLEEVRRAVMSYRRSSSSEG